MNADFKKLLSQSAAGLSLMLGAAALTPAAAQADWSLNDLIGPAAGAAIGAVMDKNHRVEHAAIGAVVGGAVQQVYKQSRPTADQPRHEGGRSASIGMDVVNAAQFDVSGKVGFRTNGFGSSAYTVTVNGNPVKALQAIGRLTQSMVVFPAEEAAVMAQQGEDAPMSARLNVSRYSPESALSGMSAQMEKLGWSSTVVRRGGATAIVVGSPDRVLDISQQIENGQLVLQAPSQQQGAVNSTPGIADSVYRANSTMNSVNSTIQTARNTLYTIERIGR